MDTRYKTWLGMAGSAAVLGLTMASAQADPVTFFKGEQLLTDRNAETIIDTNGDGTINAGDIFEGIIEFGKNESLEGLGTKFYGNTNNEFTGWFKFVVTGTTTVSPGNEVISFAPDPGFAADLAALANVPHTAAELAGVGIGLFQEAPGGTPFERITCGSIAACVGTATGGSFVTSLGFTGDPDELVSIGIPGALQGAPTTSIAGLLASLPTSPATSTVVAQLQLSFIQSTVKFSEVDASFTGPGGNGRIGFAGSTSLARAASGSPFDIFTLTLGTVNVPEPTALGLIGLGLIGVAGASLRRRRSGAAAAIAT